MAISKTVRFEVFKRDSFTCQYCGKSAPDVILQVDHIVPVSKNGTDDMTNLVTSCQDCNLGKSNHLLSDDTVVKQRKRQLDDLQERREQLEMMMEWQRSLLDLEGQAVNELSELWSELVPGYQLNDNGIQKLQKWLKKYSVSEVIEAMKIASTTYLVLDTGGNIIHESVEKAWKKVPGICYIKRKDEDKPYLKDLFYIRGILRNRCSFRNDDWKWQSMQLMEKAIEAGINIDDIRHLAKQVDYWPDFVDTVESWLSTVSR